MKNLVKILIIGQLLFLLILSTGLLNHVLLIPSLLQASGRDSWVSVLVSYPVALLLIVCIYYIAKHTREGFFAAVRKRFGSIMYYILGAPVILFLIVSSYITLKDLIIWLNAYFLADTPQLLITILLIIVCFIVTLAGIKHMAISAGMLFLFVVLFGTFIALTNTTQKDPSLLFPIMSNGTMPVAKGMIYTLSGLLEVYLIVLLQPYMQDTLKMKHLIILVTFLAILILGPLSAAIMEFGPTEANNMRYPAYEEWRILSIGEYISHLDFFALYQWLSGAIIRVGLFMFLAGAFFTKKIQHYKLNLFLVIFLYMSLLFALLMLKIETYFFYEWLYRYFFPACMIFFVGQILLSTLIVIFMKKRGSSDDRTKTELDTSS
ncbi:endospore germination permease [Bacillus sp. 165]|uniref:endospore germination permease n=1 Tax=Bacillus sp. 165 TaxID=1529117 RepID=UPI001ADB3706|nr:endospore germination permease [Bacillus sp. 165]MBO9129022.1 endospore germination permease [Bacillus sp. 165]